MPEWGLSRREQKRFFAPSLPGVPIFNYHGLAESSSHEMPYAMRKYTLSPENFRSHLACIRDEDFRVAILDDLRDRSSGTAPQLPTTAVTFDDGLASDYEIAFPLLTEFGMRAVFFLNTTTVGQGGYLNWVQVDEMHRHGMSFQSHSHRHVDLTVLPTPQLNFELSESKHLLEDRLGIRVDFLAAPHGVLDRRVVDQAVAVGYRAVCSTRCWPASPNSRVLTRITLHRNIPIGEFHGFLSGNPWPYLRRLSRGLLYRPLGLAGHVGGVLRHRLLKLPVTVSK